MSITFRSSHNVILTSCILLMTIGASVQPLVAWGSSEQPPNLFFIFADDLGWGDLACHGHPQIRTPHLDRLAAEGTDFHHFTVCNPVCSPSRTAIVTGHFPSRHSVHQHFASHEQNVARNMPDWLDPGVTLLPRLLKQAGYRTGHFGKWHLSGGAIQHAPLPAEYGFDQAAVWTGPGQGVFEGSTVADQAGTPQNAAASYLSVAATDHTIRFIRESADSPFYVNLWLHETHHVVSATTADREPYAGTPEPEQTYFAAVTRADRQVGRVLKVLQELGMEQRTVVVFSSDNGPENKTERLAYSVGSTGGMKGRKRSLYMGGVCVPFLVRWPGHVPAGRVDDRTALAGVDILPTFLAIAGVELPAGYQPDGENILPALEGKPWRRSKPLFWFWQGHHGGVDWPVFAMREGRWGLVMDESGQRVELYDLISDRYQQSNLADEAPERVASMQKCIEQWCDTLPGLAASLQVQHDRQRSASNRNASTVDRSAIFDKKDRNGDGKLTLEEYLERFPDQAEGRRRFPKFDKNVDGVLSRQEFVGR